MGIADSQGLCGIAMAPSYPVKKGPNPPKPGPEPGPKPGPKPGPTPPKPGPVKCDDVSDATRAGRSLSPLIAESPCLCGWKGHGG